MDSKIMQIFYGNDCLPYKDQARSVHYPIVGNTFVGASNTTEIRFYFKEIGDTSNAWVSVAKLPNGKIGTKVLSVAYDDTLNENYALLKLNSFYTQAMGDLFITLRAYQGGASIVYNPTTATYEVEGDPIIQVTGSVKLRINYATNIPAGLEEEIDFDQMMAEISTKLDKKSPYYFKVVNALTDINTLGDYLNSGDVIYSKTEQKIYSLNGTYPNLVATEVVLDDYITISALNSILTGYVDLTSTQTISGQKTFSGGIKTDSIEIYDTYLSITLKNDDYIEYDTDTFYINLENGINPENQCNLGSQYAKFGDLYLAGVISDGTNSVSVANIENKQNKTTSINQNSTNTQYPTAKAVYDLVEAVKTNAFTQVNTTQYPTLNQFLASTGEEGYIYLYPINTSDLSQGYYQYIWENNQWINLGTTQIGLTGFVHYFEFNATTTTDDLIQQIELYKPFIMYGGTSTMVATLMPGTEEDYYYLDLITESEHYHTEDFTYNELIINVVSSGNLVLSYSPIITLSQPMQTLSDNQMQILSQSNSCIYYNGRVYTKANESNESIEFVSADYDNTTSGDHNVITKYSILVNKTTKGTNVLTTTTNYYTKEQTDALFDNVDSRIQVSTNGGETYGDPITPQAWVAGIENEIYDVGTIFKITKAFNGKTMRFITIGLKHDVLSNTDLGEVEPNGEKAKMTLQCYDMPFGKVNLGFPFEEYKEGNLRTSEDSGTSIDDCRSFIIESVYPSNTHGYATAVGLRQAEQAFYDGLAPWLQALIKVVRKDIFISEIDDGDNYEMFDSTATVIAFENDRYGSQVDCKVFSLSAAEVGIIPNPQSTPNDSFPYSVPNLDGVDVMLEGKKYEFFNETYAYTSEPQNDRRRSRYWNNQLWNYWLRSPHLDGSYGWGFVGIVGSVDYYYTYDFSGVAPAFCI